MAGEVVVNIPEYGVTREQLLEAAVGYSSAGSRGSAVITAVQSLPEQRKCAAEHLENAAKAGSASWSTLKRMSVP